MMHIRPSFLILEESLPTRQKRPREMKADAMYEAAATRAWVEIPISKGESFYSLTKGDCQSPHCTTPPPPPPPPPSPSLKALLLNLLLFKEILLKDADEEVISALGAVYGHEAFKGMRELLKDATLFKIADSISISFHLLSLFTLVGLFLT